MILISHICWLLILHLPEYSQASNHAESSFRFGSDYEYKYGTVPKRKDKHIYRFRAYDSNQPKWKLKNIDKNKFVFFGQNLVENLKHKHSATEYIYDKSDIPPRNLKQFIYNHPRFTIIRKKKRKRTRTKPTSEPTRTPNQEENWTTIAPYESDERDEEENLPGTRPTTTEPHRPRHTTAEPHRPRYTTAEPHRPRYTTAEPHQPRHTTTEPHQPSHTITEPRPEVTTQTTHKSTTRTHTPYTNKRPWYKRFKDKINSLWPWSY